jgi:hypothetical protein
VLTEKRPAYCVADFYVTVGSYSVVRVRSVVTDDRPPRLLMREIERHYEGSICPLA